MTYRSDTARFWRRYHGDTPMPADDNPFPRFHLFRRKDTHDRHDRR